jgi:hypothetical protein
MDTCHTTYPKAKAVRTKTLLWSHQRIAYALDLTKRDRHASRIKKHETSTDNTKERMMNRSRQYFLPPFHTTGVQYGQRTQLTAKLQMVNEEKNE